MINISIMKWKINYDSDFIDSYNFKSINESIIFDAI